MTQEEKELLIKDLCSRLPYGIKVKSPGGSVDYISAINVDADTLTVLYNGYTNKIEKFIPYLRTMASMTEGERKHLQKLPFPYDFIDWLNAHYFDYRRLIEKGLAIEVTKDNNPYKE